MNATALTQLNGFTGTQTYNRLFPWTGFYLTEGTMFLAENAEAFWLMGEIASVQNTPTFKNDEMLQGMQFWKLEKNVYGDGATLTCERDEGDVAYKKTIPYTDFPFSVLPTAKIWVAPTLNNQNEIVRIAYLPSEH